MPERLTGFEDLLHIVMARLSEAEQPFLVAIAGPPASGKSTLAEKLVTALGQRGHAACLCPMDGFHLTNAELDARGLASVKGRIDTFDGAAFAAAVRKLKSGAPFWWPAYSRRTHEPVRHGTRIDGAHKVHVIEGNYLFDDREPWCSVRTAYDLRVFFDASDALLHTRLMRRHRRSGRSAQQASDKIAGTDLPNARVIRTGLPCADYVFMQEGDS